MREMLTPGRYLFAYGIFYPEGGTHTIDAKHLIFLDRDPASYRFERPDWWVRQIRQLADFYLRAEFGDGPINFRNYRTKIALGGVKTERLPPGDRHHLAARLRLRHRLPADRRGPLPGGGRGRHRLPARPPALRRHQRGHRLLVPRASTSTAPHERKIFASEFGDDYDAIPCYEQIYALAGPTQTYRITGDPLILSDIERTVRLFDRHFLDPEAGRLLLARRPDHARRRAPVARRQPRPQELELGRRPRPGLPDQPLPGDGRRRATPTMLEYTFDTITEHFQDYDNSPFVQEKFHEDWSHDQTWGWQQNRGVVGHNLKIAWNLMRMNSLKREATKYVEFAEKIAELMPAASAWTSSAAAGTT